MDLAPVFVGTDQTTDALTEPQQHIRQIDFAECVLYTAPLRFKHRIVRRKRKRPNDDILQRAARDVKPFPKMYGAKNRIFYVLKFFDDRTDFFVSFKIYGERKVLPGELLFKRLQFFK